MSYAAGILPEFEQEMASTRKLLERLPEDKFDWKAHPKSNTIGWNANHIAEIPGWVEGTLNQPQWDISPPGGPAYETPSNATRQAVLDFFDKNVAAAKRAIESATDEQMAENWSLLYGGETVFTMPRKAWWLPAPGWSPAPPDRAALSS